LLLNKTIRDNIIEHIRNGSPIETACMASGISKPTFYNWMNKVECGDCEQIYIDFFNEVKKAEAENIASRVRKIQEAGEKTQNWMANAWLLERKYPHMFGKRDVVELHESKVLIALRNRFQALREQKQLPEGEPEGVTEGEYRCIETEKSGEKQSESVKGVTGRSKKA